jgi:hypothetical protein
MPLIYQQLATLVDAYDRIQKLVLTPTSPDDKAHWVAVRDMHAASIDRLMANAPSGSGIDRGTQLILSKSDSERLTFACSFHHMSEWGSYDGWTEHVVTVRASLTSDIRLQISGRDRNEIKDYLHDVYSHWLASEVPAHAPQAEETT